MLSRVAAPPIRRGLTLTDNGKSHHGPDVRVLFPGALSECLRLAFEP